MKYANFYCRNRTSKSNTAKKSRPIPQKRQMYFEIFIPPRKYTTRNLHYTKNHCQHTANTLLYPNVLLRVQEKNALPTLVIETHHVDDCSQLPTCIMVLHHGGRAQSLVLSVALHNTNDGSKTQTHAHTCIPEQRQEGNSMPSQAH